MNCASPRSYLLDEANLILGGEADKFIDIEINLQLILRRTLLCPLIKLWWLMIRQWIE